MERQASLVLACGILVRLAWALWIPVQPVSDSAAYDSMALTLWHHGVYGWQPDQPSAYWAVGTSALAAATYVILGHSYWGIVGFNLLASALLMWTTWQIGRNQFGERAGFAALVLVAAWPNLIFFTSILSSELYFMSLTMAGLFFWLRTSGNRWLSVLACGLLWGLACYFRPVILLFPVAMAIAAVSQGWRKTIIDTARAGIAVSLIVLVASPWTARNAEVLGRAYLMSSNFGANFWMGNNPDTQGDYMPLPPEVAEMTEVERDDYLKSLAKDHIRAEPFLFLQRFALRILDLHGRETIGVVWNEAALMERLGSSGVFILKLIASGYWVLLVLAAISAIVILWRKWTWGALFHPIFGGWAYFTAVHAIIVSGDRYHMPSGPFVVLLAGFAVTWFFKGQRQEQVGAT